MLKYYITVSLRQFAKTLNQFFFTYIVQSAKENVESRIQVSFEQLKELKFGVLSLNNT